MDKFENEYLMSFFNLISRVSSQIDRKFLEKFNGLHFKTD